MPVEAPLRKGISDEQLYRASQWTARHFGRELSLLEKLADTSGAMPAHTEYELTETQNPAALFLGSKSEVSTAPKYMGVEVNLLGKPLDINAIVPFEFKNRYEIGPNYGRHWYVFPRIRHWESYTGDFRKDQGGTGIRGYVLTTTSSGGLNPFIEHDQDMTQSHEERHQMHWDTNATNPYEEFHTRQEEALAGNHDYASAMHK